MEECTRQVKSGLADGVRLTSAGRLEPSAWPVGVETPEGNAT